MFTVPIRIVRLISDAYPGFVAGELVDALGNTHTFENKVPVIALDHLDANSELPSEGVLACEILERWTGADGRDLATINTERPWDIPSTDDKYHFVVPVDRLSSGPPTYR